MSATEEKVTYKPHHEGGYASNITQYCTMHVDGQELETVLFATHFPHNFTKDPFDFYLFFAFDCQDEKYEEKLAKLNPIAEKYGVTICEEESVHLHGWDIQTEKVIEIDSAIKTAMR
jgi:hypothetical protein